MRIIVNTILVVMMTLSHPGFVVACLWDYDTLAMERQRFPGTLELITGKFLRHSPEFYEWRVGDRLKKIETDPDNLKLYDDLAVAYDKLGQHDLAIETILKKDKIKPGQYETHANLGTFLIHAGKLEEGLVHTEKAIEINPDAHFGREVYQKLLVEYVLSKRDENGQGKLPLYSTAEENTGPFGLVPTGFAKFVIEERVPDQKSETSHKANEKELQKALTGVLGMMRFGHHDSPILLEAVGDLLKSQTAGKGDAKQLAARAYLKASYETEDQDAKLAYRKLAESVLDLQTSGPGSHQSIKLKTLEASFRKELREAEKWYNGVRLNELKWIKDKTNVDEEFAKKYYEDPKVSGSGYSVPLIEVFNTKQWMALGALGLFLFYVGYRLYREVRMRSGQEWDIEQTGTPLNESPDNA